MKSIPTHNSQSPAPLPPPSSALCSPFKSRWFIVAQSPWLAGGECGSGLCLCAPRSERRNPLSLCGKKKKNAPSFPSPAWERASSLLVLRRMKSSIHVFSFGGGLRGGGGGGSGSGGRHRGRAKMAAGSAGMKTVTFAHQSLHSAPRPGWASHTGAPPLMCDILRSAVWPHVNYKMHNRCKWWSSFFFFTRKLYRRINISSVWYNVVMLLRTWRTDGWMDVCIEMGPRHKVIDWDGVVHHLDIWYMENGWRCRQAGIITMFLCVFLRRCKSSKVRPGPAWWWRTAWKRAWTPRTNTFLTTVTSYTTSSSTR